ncbi:DNA polymerase, partial [Myxococcus sp. XM-1-1-1]|uniref:DNA polymerase n=1 Tax=Myxococcus sp. XM-1-1-1 TaxID=2874602 RepID=UPI00351D97DC
MEELGKAGKVDKYRSTYLGKLEAGTTAPLTPRFNVLVSTTRVSSDYQQLPQRGGVRECHKARPGYVFCSVDYAGLELRTMAQRAIWDVGYSRMAEALLAKEDVHTSAAATFLGERYEALLPRVKAKEPTATSFRSLAKIFNFGKGGGLGAGGMAYHARAKDGVRFCLLAKVADACGVERVPVRVQGKVKMVCAACVEVSRHYGNRWLDAWPEQRALFGRASALTRNGQLVDVTIPGANILRGGCGYTQWLNTPFQGLGAVGAKLATWRVKSRIVCSCSEGVRGRNAPWRGQAAAVSGVELSRVM